MTDKMKTVCVGRFLVDIPEEARVRLGMTWLHGFKVVTEDESAEDFRQALASREASLAASTNMLGRKSLELAREVRGEGYMGKVFVHSRTRGYTVRNEERVYYEAVTTEGHVNRDGMTFSFESDGDGPERVPVVVGMMSRSLTFPQTTIPQLPGFCIDGALVADDSPGQGSEAMTLFATLPGHPDFWLEFWTMTSRDQGPGLLVRNAAATDALTRSRTRVLREGPRTINGLPGEEIGAKVTEMNFTTNFDFEWEHRAAGDDVLRPMLSLGLETGRNPSSGGKPVQSSLSEEAVVKLWDRISSSVRLRPTGPAKVAEAAPPLTPLGTWAEAGERCPQSGWWLCADGGNGVGVLGGQRQYLREGQKIPQALLLPPQTVWQRMRGLQPSYESRTRSGWKLVDKRLRERTAPGVPLAQATLAARADAGSAIAGSFSSAQAAAPIGCCVKTGMQCPASGWWRCEESAALDGTRWFAAGSLLPAATFALLATGLQRTLGKPEAIQRRSQWQLVRHAPAPDAQAREAAPGGEDDAPADA